MSDSVDRVEDGATDGSVSRGGFIKYGLLAFSGMATAAGVLTPIVAYLWPPKVGAGAAETRVLGLRAAN